MYRELDEILFELRRLAEDPSLGSPRTMALQATSFIVDLDDLKFINDAIHWATRRDLEKKAEGSLSGRQVIWLEIADRIQSITRKN